MLSRSWYGAPLTMLLREIMRAVIPASDFGGKNCVPYAVNCCFYTDHCH